MLFYKENTRETCCKGCSNVLQIMSYLLQVFISDNLLFLEITFQYKTRACQKKKKKTSCNLSYRTGRTKKRLSANNKGKFSVVVLRNRLVKFKATQGEGRITSLQVSNGNNCFRPDLPLGKFN